MRSTCFSLSLSAAKKANESCLIWIEYAAGSTRESDLQFMFLNQIHAYPSVYMWIIYLVLYQIVHLNPCSYLFLFWERAGWVDLHLLPSFIRYWSPLSMRHRGAAWCSSIQTPYCSWFTLPTWQVSNDPSAQETVCFEKLDMQGVQCFIVRLTVEERFIMQPYFICLSMACSL